LLRLVSGIVHGEQKASLIPNETTMRRSAMLGTALLIIGGTVFLRSLSAERAVVSVGDTSISVEERSPVVWWAAILAVVGGIVLVTGRRRNA
jgi:hypothetical protein